jgi:hypothetical protein
MNIIELIERLQEAHAKLGTQPVEVIIEPGPTSFAESENLQSLVDVVPDAGRKIIGGYTKPQIIIRSR